MFESRLIYNEDTMSVFARSARDGKPGDRGKQITERILSDFTMAWQIGNGVAAALRNKDRLDDPSFQLAWNLPSVCGTASI